LAPEAGPRVRFTRIDAGIRDCRTAVWPLPPPAFDNSSAAKRQSIFAPELSTKKALQYQWPMFGAEFLQTVRKVVTIGLARDSLVQRVAIESRMTHISGFDRCQLLLLPEAIDDYVGSDNPVRFIDAFVDRLDLAAVGFERVTPKATGRPGYAPADLLKLYIYGYLNRVRSSRRLEAEAKRNIELIWLLGGLKPDFKTSPISAATIAPLFPRFSGNSLSCAGGSICSGANSSLWMERASRPSTTRIATSPRDR
jgi:hypothetical protein